MFTAALFIIAPKKKQPKSPSMNEQVKCGKSIQVGCYLGIKSKEVLIHATIMNEPRKQYAHILLASFRSQSPKNHIST